MKLLRLWTTVICGGLFTFLVATGPNLSELKSALAGAASVPLSFDGSFALSEYLMTNFLPGWRPNGADVPTVILSAWPFPSGDTIFSSNWIPLTTSTRYCSSLSSELPISMDTESGEGGSNIPGISSSSLITLIAAEPLFSTVIVASISELTYVLILERSNFFNISASSTVRFCSLIDISPLDSEEALGRME